MEFIHLPVMLEEALEGLNLIKDGNYIDCTLGGAGHTMAILERIGPKGRVIALDLDADAIAAAREKAANYGSRLFILQGNFTELRCILGQLGLDRVDGVLFDLGVSSYQLDNPVRGFGYQHDAPLDMRMDQTKGPTAADLVNNLPVEKLAKIIKEYGEERWADRIASFIETERGRSPVATTGQLSQIIKKAIPAAVRHGGPHPARRTFQALRIALNNELNSLREALQEAVTVLRPGGRLCVITFHSLEDRIVKEFFRELSISCTCPKDFPACICGKKKIIKIISRKPVLPSASELAGNPRARSAKLRIAEKL